MADEPSPSSQFERALTRLTSALRAQTNAMLEVKQLSNEVKQQLASVTAKLDHLIATEAAEAVDVREIRQFLFDATQKITETRASVQEARRSLEEIEEITGKHALPTPEDRQRADDAQRWRMVSSTAKFFKEHWPHITISSGIGAAVYHFLQRIFH